MLFNYIVLAIFVIDIFTYIHKEWLEYVNTHWLVEVFWFFSLLASIMWLGTVFVWGLNNAHFFS